MCTDSSVAPEAAGGLASSDTARSLELEDNDARSRHVLANTIIDLAQIEAFTSPANLASLAAEWHRSRAAH